MPEPRQQVLEAPPTAMGTSRQGQGRPLCHLEML